ncbi:prolyl oligopeptidase family serine peptidase [Flavobacterium sp. ZT3R25]|uniref:S9 family peptidase n=1 Tax=Flavobacterium galactosi TaxID=3398735 RepID=UPI003A874C82
MWRGVILDFCRLAVYFFCFSSCLVTGQHKQKQVLRAADYPFWGTLSVDKLSDKGDWVSFYMRYENGTDTLFVTNTSTRKRFAFPKGKQGQFNREQVFACLDADKNLKLIYLLNGVPQSFAGVSTYTFTANQKYLVLERYDETKHKYLEIRKPTGEWVKTIDRVKQWELSPSGNSLLYTKKDENTNSVVLLNLEDKPISTLITQSASSVFFGLVWHEKSLSAAWMAVAQGREPQIQFYSIGSRELFTLEPEKIAGFPRSMQVNSKLLRSLRIASEGKCIFFNLQMKDIQTSPPSVQVWNSADTMLYPSREMTGGNDHVDRVAVWLPEKGRFLQITNKEQSQLLLAGNGRFAVTNNPWEEEPQFRQNAVSDFYITDLETNTKELLLKGQLGANGQLLSSPAGKHIGYFRDGDWWTYNLFTKKHRNVTGSLGVSFYDNATGEPFGHPGWEDKDSSMLVYDQYDIWKLDPDGNALRLTRGRESGTVFRVVETTDEQSVKLYQNGYTAGRFDSNTGWVLSSRHLESGATAFYEYDQDKGIRLLDGGAFRVVQLVKAAGAKGYSYTIESYDCSPSLHYKKVGRAKSVPLFESNLQQKHFEWGSEKLISYDAPDGQQLQGILYYPAGYESTKKYPMVVSIYQKQSHHFHQYLNPSQKNNRGFNFTDYTARGYFVLLADIVYQKGKVGMSAVACVSSAVKAALTEKAIDTNRLGLIGHSFGGYETNYIITQTKLFAAAVSGAGISDLVSSYLYYNPDSVMSNMWRLENFPYYMGGSLHEITNVYLENSPVLHAKDITTPLLSWAGEEDRQVSVFQSIEFYNALRRLGKKHIMLLYPKEGHVLMNAANKRDLNTKIREWFDFYLKAAPAIDWMKPDFTIR